MAAQLDPEAPIPTEPAETLKDAPGRPEKVRRAPDWHQMPGPSLARTEESDRMWTESAECETAKTAPQPLRCRSSRIRVPSKSELTLMDAVALDPVAVMGPRLPVEFVWAPHRTSVGVIKREPRLRLHVYGGGDIRRGQSQADLAELGAVVNEGCCCLLVGIYRVNHPDVRKMQ
jgi:hypothetical protein